MRSIISAQDLPDHAPPPKPEDMRRHTTEVSSLLRDSRGLRQDFHSEEKQPSTSGKLFQFSI